MLCWPAVRSVVLTVAVLPLSAAVPKVVFVVVSRKVTLPVGVPAPGETGATVAVMVSDCPNVEGFGATAVTLVVVPALSTTCERAGVDVLGFEFVSPA